ncbi:hypothetical protein FXO38_33698 [Capsicum annuum]|nr:hypothetical protein FXO38_33698 [Capsicum annuum]
MWLQKWMRDFKPEEDLPISPVWVLLPKLPFHMHTWQYIKQIVSSVVTPVEMDQATRSRTRPSMDKNIEKEKGVEQQKLEEQNREKDSVEHTNIERQNEQGRTLKMDSEDNDDEKIFEKSEGKKDASNKVEHEKKENIATICKRINKDKKRKLPKKKFKVSFMPNIV